MNFITSVITVMCNIFDIKNNDYNSEKIKLILNEYKPIDKNLNKINFDELGKEIISTKDNFDLDNIVRELKLIEPNSDLKLNAIEFEKDEDSNGQMSLIYTTSTLRAWNHGIEEVDFYQVKLRAMINVYYHGK